jgi:phosphatidylglycerol lysyltransferase
LFNFLIVENPGSHRLSVRLLSKMKLEPIRENSKFIANFLLAVLFITVGAWFYKHEQPELGEIKHVLLTSSLPYIILGVAVTAIYIVLQGFMYKMSFASVGKKVSLSSAIILFLKRNFISIFMPAGGVASLAFFTDEIESGEGSKTKIHIASSIYAFTGILTTVLIAIPILIYAVARGISGVGEIIGLAAMILLVSVVYLMYKSLINKKIIYRIIVRIFPSSEVFIGDLINHSIDTKYIIYTILISVSIDITCIFLVFTAMAALGLKASLFYAMLGYLTGVVSTFVSPFMRGLGAVELSMSFILTKLGYAEVEALAITLLYRFFEFWLPLLTGAISFLLKINKLLLRVIPAFLIFALGLVNIISSITPAIADRMHRLEDFIPLDAIAASNFFVFIAGLFLLLTAIFMLKGLRNAWWIALVLSVVSCVGHLTKAIDYEEAIFAIIILVILLFSRKEYHVKGNPKLHRIGVWAAVLSIIAVIIYGTIGFYLLDKKHFGIEFNFWQSIAYTLKNFIFLGNSGLVPDSRFAKDFLISINVSGFVSLSFLFYTILRPYFYRESTTEEEFKRARLLVQKFGSSSLDYFKTYYDKMIFAPEGLAAFLAYRTAGNFAFVLENPVAETREDMKQCILNFDEFCYDNGFRSIFYRVPEESLALYRDLSKKSLFLGQEAVLDLNTFTLEGGKNKALRNALNKVTDEGYKSSVHIPPIKDGLLQKLKAVSDEWLDSTGRDEIVFSQGMFRWDQLKNQTILTVENAEEKVIAFLNIIPDLAPGEGTYDLIRKTEDSPHGVMDYILVELFRYMKSLNYSKVNLGFAPMSGLDDPHTFPERTMKFAYEKIRSFSHFKGSRNFKEKFFPVWYNKYLIYSQDYDLLQVPSALARVIKPGHD